MAFKLKSMSTCPRCTPHLHERMNAEVSHHSAFLSLDLCEFTGKGALVGKSIGWQMEAKWSLLTIMTDNKSTWHNELSWPAADTPCYAMPSS